jgi:hypothetical protein
MLRPAHCCPRGHHCVTAVEIATESLGLSGDSITSVAPSLEHDLHLPNSGHARVLTNPPVESHHCIGSPFPKIRRRFADSVLLRRDHVKRTVGFP